MKVSLRLAAEDFVTSVRGRSGGLALKHAPKDINIGSVVRKLEDYGSFVVCFDAEKTPAL